MSLAWHSYQLLQSNDIVQQQKSKGRGVSRIYGARGKPQFAPPIIFSVVKSMKKMTDLKAKIFEKM